MPRLRAEAEQRASIIDVEVIAILTSVPITFKKRHKPGSCAETQSDCMAQQFRP
jgi:hypothetical protein